MKENLFTPNLIALAFSLFFLILVLLADCYTKKYEAKVANKPSPNYLKCISDSVIEIFSIFKIKKISNEKKILKGKTAQEIFLYLTEIFFVIGTLLFILNIFCPISSDNISNYYYQVIERFFLLYTAYQLFIVVILNISISDTKDSYIALRRLSETVNLYLKTSDLKVLEEIKDRILLDLNNDTNSNRELIEYCEFLKENLELLEKDGKINPKNKNKINIETQMNLIKANTKIENNNLFYHTSFLLHLLK